MSGEEDTLEINRSFCLATLALTPRR